MALGEMLRHRGTISQSEFATEKMKADTSKTEDPATRSPEILEQLLGVKREHFTTWHSFVSMINRPTDASSLAVFRIVYGLCMVLDIPFERGLSVVEQRYSNQDECRFPLFDVLSPLPLVWMYMVYLGMFIGAVGIMLGLLYRGSCLLFLTTYWYVYLLDKTVWNNHSYLYGLCAFILLWCDANRYWSLDGLLRPKIHNKAVPLWNYTLLRTQFFLVYFIAGLKKMDLDWLSGFSMQSLAQHWVFSPFTYILSHDNVDFWIVHLGGFFYDLTNGFLLVFDATRLYGITFSLMFHGLNAQMFSIGMFPYVMLATLPIFCYADWPKKLLGCSSRPLQTSTHCVHKKQDSNAQKKKSKKKSPILVSQTSRLHHLGAVLTVLYITVQCVLPYSHSLTPGYNAWTNGLYGYSWDMMVHTWTTQHLRVSYIDEATGESGYLKPDAWTPGYSRWSSHPDMIKQYANCINSKLKKHGLTSVKLYFDIWRSLNNRFQQRMFDPRVDILTAPWSVTRPTPWVMPLLADLSHWRRTMDQIEKQVYSDNEDVDIVFMADFPGLTMENYLQPDLGNASLVLLSGEIIVELLERGENHTLHTNQSLQLPTGEYHNVHTVPPEPACFMYQYINTTEQKLQAQLKAKDQDSDASKTELHDLMEKQQQRIYTSANATTWNKVKKFMEGKYMDARKSMVMTGLALKSLVTGEKFESLITTNQ